MWNVGPAFRAKGPVVSWLPPPWLVVIWMQFAMTFH